MKRILATLMALLMLAMPLAGLAESVPADKMDLNSLMAGQSENYYTAAINAGRRVTFTVSLSDVATDFTGEPAVDQVIYDILNALVITGYVQGDEIYYAISMKQESGDVADLLTMGVAVAGDDAYILTNLIGGTIVLGEDEVMPVMERIIDMLVMMGYLTESDAEYMKAEMNAALAAAQEQAVSAMGTGLDALDVTALDYSALIEAVTLVSGKMVAGEMDVLPKNCDQAAAMVTVTMTPAEMNGLIASVLKFVRDNPELANAIAAEIDFDNTIAPEISGVSGEPVDILGFIDMMLAELETAQLYTGDTVLRMWVDETGSIVAMNCVAPTSEGDLTIDYGRLTMNEGVAHSVLMAFPGVDITLSVLDGGEHIVANFAVAEDGAEALSMQIDYTDRSAGNLVAADVVIDMTITEATVNMNASYVGGETYEMNDVVEELNIRLDFTTDMTVTGVDFVETDTVTIAVNGKEYATLNMSAVTGEAGDSIKTGDVVRPAELNDADFANWFIGAYSAMYAWLQNALYAMPVSLINLMNTGF